MKTKALLTTLIIGAICQFAPSIGQAQDVDSMAPVVVKTVPEAGTKDVSPGIVETDALKHFDTMRQDGLIQKAVAATPAATNSAFVRSFQGG